MIWDGPSGTVLLGLHKLTRKIVALKNVDIKHAQENVKSIENQYEILSQLIHPNII